MLFILFLFYAFAAHDAAARRPPVLCDDFDGVIIKWKKIPTVLPPLQLNILANLIAFLLGDFEFTLNLISNSLNQLSILRIVGQETYAVQRLLATLRTLPLVEYVEPNLRVYPFAEPNDFRFPDQWQYKGRYTDSAGNQFCGMNFTGAWNWTTGNSSIVVASLDTGVLYDHPDLATRLLPGYDMISIPSMANDGDGGRDSDASDPGDYRINPQTNEVTYASSWHGTHIAGILGAMTNNCGGVAGTTWNTQILPVRVLGSGGGLVDDILAGMLWAAGDAISNDIPVNPNPARVISLSLGSRGPCPKSYQEVINRVVAKNITVVVSAGNGYGANATDYNPCNCENVICVGAHGPTGSIASYSNQGPKVDIFAPGGDFGNQADYVLSTSNDGQTRPGQHTYAYRAGTSMAAPHVSGLAALMLSMVPSLTPSQIVDIIVKTSQNISSIPVADAGAAVSQLAQLFNYTRPSTSLNASLEACVGSRDYVNGFDAGVAPDAGNLVTGSPSPSPSSSTSPSPSPSPSRSPRPYNPYYTPPPPPPTRAPRPSPIPSPQAMVSPSPAGSPYPSASPIPSLSDAPSPSATPSPSGAPSPSDMPSPSDAPSPSEAPSPSQSPSSSPSAQPSASPLASFSPSGSPSQISASASQSTSSSGSPSPLRSPSLSRSPSPSRHPSPSRSRSPHTSPSRSSVSPIPSSSPSPNSNAAAEKLAPKVTRTPTPTVTSTLTATATTSETSSPTQTSTLSQTQTTTASMTVTDTITSTASPSQTFPHSSPLSTSGSARRQDVDPGQKSVKSAEPLTGLWILAGLVMGSVLLVGGIGAWRPRACHNKPENWEMLSVVVPIGPAPTHIPVRPAVINLPASGDAAVDML